MNAEPTPADAILLLGPTASGKTAATLWLAARYDIEVISVDSAMVFRDMNIGTAKPSATEQALCPHHLIDIVSPESCYSAALFRDDALRLISEIRQRGRMPVLAGGTMLYFKALVDGLSDLPQADALMRAQIDSDAKRLGWPAMHAELAKLDAAAAAALQPMDAQRIQRALEIVRITGRPLAESYARREQATANFQYHTLALMPAERSSLHTRIAERFDIMLAAGLEGEVASLRQRYQLNAGMTSMRCVGYRQMWDYIEGRDSWSSMRDKGIAATRQLAKRQITWMRQFRQHWPHWHEIDSLKADAIERALNALPSSRAKA